VFADAAVCAAANVLNAVVGSVPALASEPFVGST